MEWAGPGLFLEVEGTVVETGGLGMETGGVEGCWFLLVRRHCCVGQTLRGKENICRYWLDGSPLQIQLVPYAVALYIMHFTFVDIASEYLPTAFMIALAKHTDLWEWLVGVANTSWAYEHFASLVVKF